MENILNNKTILLGVTGSVAAYKSPLLVRELIKLGANVKVVMTESAKEFVSELILSNLSRNDVISDMFDKKVQTSGAWHIKYAHECDLMIIAPCSVNTLSKIANSICDNSLVTLAIALEPTIPLLIAPAMDTTMWLNPATQRNINLLIQDGAIIIPPEEGELSSGLIGPGRLPEINVLIEEIIKALNQPKKNRFEIKNYKQPISNSNDKEKLNKNLQDLIDSPIEPIEKSIEKDKFNAELNFEKLKKKLS